MLTDISLFSSGTIDSWELRCALEALGQAPTEDELFKVFQLKLHFLYFRFDNYMIPNLDIFL